MSVEHTDLSRRLRGKAGVLQRFGAAALALSWNGCDDTRVRLLEPPAEVSPDSSADADAGGIGDADVPGDAGPEGPDGGDASADSLLHRYDFSGAGTLVVDSVGGAHGTVLGGATLDEAGGLVLDGIDDYVDLPNGLVSGLTDATIAVWLEWYGDGCWQRIFDFGNSDLGEDAVGQATTSLFVTPCNLPESVLSVLFEYPNEKHVLLAEGPLSGERPVFVTLVVTGSEARYQLYLDGALAGDANLVRQLGEIDDVNNWLGRSQWAQDAENPLSGRYDELRIYSEALGPDRVTRLMELGPDQL